MGLRGRIICDNMKDKSTACSWLSNWYIRLIAFYVFAFRGVGEFQVLGVWQSNAKRKGYVFSSSGVASFP
jgi:hypothetical protein